MNDPGTLRIPLLLLAALTCSCVSVLDWESGPVGSAPPPISPETAEIQRRLAEGARFVLGKTELVIRGRRFRMDCTGTVLAIYWYAGIDLARDFHKYSGNGVTRIYRSLEQKNLLYSNPRPLTGDIIFWDNTYDRNGDGLWNDRLTHVGMVVESLEDGAIQFVHLNYSNGIVIENMNLLEPDIEIMNSPIRVRNPRRPHPPRWLAGQLYRVLGMGYLF